MQDLNDLFFFAQVVTHGGFAAAGRALAQPKSKLSRRVTRLEADLGVRLIERSSRRFQVTEVGRAFYERCKSMLAEAELAQAVVHEAQGDPHGTVRIACPTGLLETPFSAALLDFLARHPRVQLRLLATNRRIDLIEERVDIAVRVRTSLDDDNSLTVRPLQRSRRILVCAPALAKTLGRVRAVSDLEGAPTLAMMSESATRERWDMVGPDGATASLAVEPRLGSLDLAVLRDAATKGLGVALLPDHVCQPMIDSGQLVHLLPRWYATEGMIHLVFTARHGLPAAVRLLIDELVARFAVPVTERLI